MGRTGKIAIMLILTGLWVAGPAFAQSGQSTPAKAASSSITTMANHGVMPDHKEVRAVQESLKAKGYDPGPIDGVLGHKTTSALKAFQKAEKLPITGELTSDTRSKLGV